jgi:hypothetical protein
MLALTKQQKHRKFAFNTIDEDFFRLGISCGFRLFLFARIPEKRSDDWAVIRAEKPICRVIR